MSGTEITSKTPGTPRSIGRWALRGFLVLFCLYVLSEVWVNSAKRQWDFRCYYYAAQVDSDGGNPYDTNALNQKARIRNVLPFVYPPITLPFFKLFAGFDFDTAYLIWYIFKLILIVALVLIWRRYLFRDVSADLFAWYVLLGMGAAVYIDLVTGNITMIEQVLLWGGFVALLRKRVLLFCATVVVASLFKFTPLFFLVLLPLTRQRRWWLYAVGSVAVFVLIDGASYLMDPSAWQAFFVNAQLADEPGMQGNPSTLALARDIAVIIGQKTSLVLGDAFAVVLYAIIGVFTVGLSWQQYRELRQSERDDWMMVVVYLACLVYALVMPRFKTYSFILVVPPALYVLQRSTNMKAFWPLLTLLLLTTSIPFPVEPFIQVFWRYYPLLLVFLVWGLLLRDVRVAGAPGIRA